MNIPDLNIYKKVRKRNIPNSQKNFNYNYNNLNDYYYSLYKKLTNKKQKVTKNNDKDQDNKKKVYNIDNEISLNFGDNNINTLELKFNNKDNVNTSKRKPISTRTKKNNLYNDKKYSTQNNFIPSGITIPNEFKNNNINTNDTKQEKEKTKEKTNAKANDTKPTLINHNSEIKIDSYVNTNQSKVSLASSNSETIKDHVDKNIKSLYSSSIPNITINSFMDSMDDISKSVFLEDLNDYVDKDNKIKVKSTYTKLNTIPYNSDIINIMNETKSINYLKLYGSRSIKNSSSSFVLDSSTESIKDKKEGVIWDRNIKIDNNNKYYQINSPVSDEDSNVLDDISDLSVSSDELREHIRKYHFYFSFS